MNKEYITTSAEETQRVGEQFTKEINRGVVCLYGDLGFGKTTFVQGFAKGLGLERRIISPTFVILRTYHIPDSQNNFYHVDLYRIQMLQDIHGLGLFEIMSGQEAIVLIEWPEKLGEFLPKERWDVKFDYLNENERKILITHVKK